MASSQRYSGRIPNTSSECCYSSTIMTVANVCMFITIAIYLYNFLLTLYASTTYNVVYMIFIGFIVTFGIVVCVLVIYGGRAMKPWAFLPYLFMTGIGITFILLLSLILFTHGLTQQDYAYKNLETSFTGLEMFKNRDEGKITEYTARVACMAITLNLFCMSVVGLLMSSLLPIAVWILVFQSYRYVKNVIRISPPPSYDAIAIEVVAKELVI